MTNVDELWFFNETQDIEFKLKLSLSESQWRQAHFTVTLHMKGDSVSILNSKNEDQ